MAVSALGYYDDFGGRFVAETLVPALEELEKAYQQRVAFYNDEIKKFKQKAKLKSHGL